MLFIYIKPYVYQMKTETRFYWMHVKLELRESELGFSGASSNVKEAAEDP